jgi:DNA-binding LytR/AlgR family response regulator
MQISHHDYKTNDMKQQSQPNSIVPGRYPLQILKADEIVTTFKWNEEFKDLFQQSRLPNLDELITKLGLRTGKKSFLVFKNNKYVNVLTENIAYFYVKYESSVIATYDRKEYFVNYSLEQIQNLLPEKQFFRVNRQYLINFTAVKEVEHYFARKLLVNLVIPTTDKLIVPKEKATGFFNWLDNR